ncbi:uncharacterized protein V6R79_011921 [Siganus canaliculatus]
MLRENETLNTTVESRLQLLLDFTHTSSGCPLWLLTEAVCVCLRGTAKLRLVFAGQSADDVLFSDGKKKRKKTPLFSDVLVDIGQTDTIKARLKHHDNSQSQQQHVPTLRGSCTEDQLIRFPKPISFHIFITF